MFFLKIPGLKLLKGQKVIKSDQYQNYLDGLIIIEEGKKQAGLIIEEAKKAYEEEKKKGYNDGVEIGKKKMMDHMMSYVSKSITGYEMFEEKVLQIIMQALYQILGEMDKKELVKGVVKQVIGTIRTQKEIVLKVAPAQKEYVQTQVQEFLNEYPSINFIDVIEDGRLKEGDCIAETDVGVVDGRLEIQLEAIKKAFTKKIK